MSYWIARVAAVSGLTNAMDVSSQGGAMICPDNGEDTTNG